MKLSDLQYQAQSVQWVPHEQLIPGLAALTTAL